MSGDDGAVRNGRVSTLGRILTEPLAHFFLLGIVLLVAESWLGGEPDPGSRRIVVGQHQVEQLASVFERTWRRPPTESELAGLVEDHIREELAYREAVALGLDREDTVIRRRLQQKLEFLAEDLADAGPPTRLELQAFLDARPELFAREPAVALRQVYIDPMRHESPLAVARDVLAALVKAGEDADLTDFGDPLMIDTDFPLTRQGELARTLGRDFAEQVVRLEPGRWHGPLESGLGLHLVFVTASLPGGLPTLDEVGALVEHEFLAERRRNQLAEFYEEVQSTYSIRVEQPSPDTREGSVP